MKILFLHVNEIRWKAKKKAIKTSFEEIGSKEDQERDALVCFVCVETGDKAKVDSAIANIEDVAKRIGVKKLVLYPYAHLFPERLAPINEAIEVLKSLFSELSKKYEVKIAAFGYYKELLIHVKGHPLAELSRRI